MNSIFKGKTALITGAASGIGAAFSRKFADEGANLVLLDINAGDLHLIEKELGVNPGISVKSLVVDLSDQGSVQDIVNWLDRSGLAVDILVCNAGYSIAKNFEDVSWDVHGRILQTMSIGVAHLAHSLLPGMLKRGYGWMLFVSSVSAYGPGTPTNTLYESVKAFVLKFSESLFFELKEKNIHVTAVCPGYTRTRHHDVEGLMDMKEKIPGFFWLEPSFVAAEGVKALKKGKPVVITGFLYKLIVFLLRLVPMSVFLHTTTLRQKIRWRNT